MCRAPLLENMLCRAGFEALCGASDVTAFSCLLHANHQRERQQQPRASGSVVVSPLCQQETSVGLSYACHSTQQAVTRNRTLPAVPHLALHESRALPAVVHRRPRPRQRAGRGPVHHRTPQPPLPLERGQAVAALARASSQLCDVLYAAALIELGQFSEDEESRIVRGFGLPVTSPSDTDAVIATLLPHGPPTPRCVSCNSATPSHSSRRRHSSPQTCSPPHDALQILQPSTVLPVVAVARCSPECPLPPGRP